MISRRSPGLKRYFEWMSRGLLSGRVAYVIDDWNLPEPVPGDEWAFDSRCNAAKELLRAPEMKFNFKNAIDDGVKVVKCSQEQG